MGTVEVLEAALERLGPNGERWKGLGGIPGHDCAANAIKRVDGADKQEAYYALADVLGVTAPGRRVVSIFRWNDDPSRTFSEVRAAFQKAIRNEKAKAAEHLDADVGGGAPGLKPSAGTPAKAFRDAADVSAEEVSAA